MGNCGVGRKNIKVVSVFKRNVLSETDLPQIKKCFPNTAVSFKHIKSTVLCDLNQTKITSYTCKSNHPILDKLTTKRKKRVTNN